MAWAEGISYRRGGRALCGFGSAARAIPAAVLAGLQRRGARLDAGDVPVDCESSVDVRSLVTAGERTRSRSRAGETIVAPELFRVPLENVQRAQLAWFEQRH